VEPRAIDLIRRIEDDRHARVDVGDDGIGFGRGEGLDVSPISGDFQLFHMSGDGAA
jgi:hypothetical protein